MVAKEQYRVSLDYFLLLLLLYASGFAFYVNSESKDIQLILIFAISVIVSIKRKTGLSISFVIITIILLLILLLQFLKFDKISISSSIGLILKFTTGYLIIALLGSNFVEYYIRAIKFICFYSLCIYLLVTTIPMLADFIVKNILPIVNSFDAGGEGNFIIFVMDKQANLYRNAGPFWEPGAFQGYINLALFFSFSKDGRILVKENLLLILGLISTLSTTGYIAMFSLVLFFSLIFSVKASKYLLIVPLFLFGALYAYESIPFLKEKINDQINSSDVRSQNTQRFNSFARDFRTIEDHYMIGTGPDVFNRYGITILDKMVVSTTGVTNIIATFGIPFFIFYIIGMFHGIKNILIINNIGNIYPIMFVILFLIISLSEGFPFQPFFWGIFANLSSKKII